MRVAWFEDVYVGYIQSNSEAADRVSAQVVERRRPLAAQFDAWQGPRGIEPHAGSFGRRVLPAGHRVVRGHDEPAAIDVSGIAIDFYPQWPDALLSIFSLIRCPDGTRGQSNCVL